ncbi:hypothetical protein [Legionella longbeachae]|uniref:Uncharacterized protein n=1 Tax=Legionella longbeachae serogroup 1 (strain NSW150) TaxID=661367 RepID=D3HKD1_LEGLN|nr:hypothetical protein [Legionella longbeachae]VEE03411.1 Uncharacterised protein [Legionella oakridgensis]HBD7397688.1 hypothetical protein [Legionella pneumophila]ARB93694.1 hypothetical protein A6J40_16600 [Legionella longbeachae]ARM33166.1 hypothetical protein B0B39_06365 [Legionella longbeachae]EEZ93986.1 conserved hypothetical protein [Legionella longbeachae D-4968]
MLKKFGFGVLCIMTSLTTNTYAMESHALQQGVTIEYELPSNDPQEFANPMYWAIVAKCKIITEDENNDLLVEALAKQGKVNETPLSKGQVLQITVYPHQILKLSADSGAKVKITNLGQHTIKASCTT